MFASAAVLLTAIGGTAAYFITREPLAPPAVVEAPSSFALAPAQAPLNIHGILLEDGPEVDPTDVVHLVRRRIAEPDSDIQLVEILAHRATRGKVNLNDPEASIRYTYLVSKTNVRAAKANERVAERVEIALRSDPQPIKRTSAASDTETVPEPLCVWNAAWRAAIASGLSEKDVFEVAYGPDPRSKGGVWTFYVKDQPESRRDVDGQTCAIKLR